MYDIETGKIEDYSWDEAVEIAKKDIVKGTIDAEKGLFRAYPVEDYFIPHYSMNKLNGIEAKYEFINNEIVLKSCNLNGRTAYRVLSGTAKIADGDFENNKGFKYKVILPKSVKSIGSACFKETDLRDINLENVTSVGLRAFYSCKELKEAVFKQNVEFSICSFENAGIEYLDLGMTMRVFSNCFKNCVNLSKVDMPCVSIINSSAFERCVGLRKVEFIKPSVSLGIDCFKHCTFLESINIDNISDDIGMNAFSGCVSLSKETIDALQAKKWDCILTVTLDNNE